MGQKTPPNNLSGPLNTGRFSQGELEKQDDQDEAALSSLHLQSLILGVYSITQPMKKLFGVI